MKWLLTFLAGVVLGAGALFIYLREIGQQPGPVTVVSAPAGAAAPAALPPASPTIIGPPDAPLISTDLSQVDLPIRPSAAELALPELVLTDPSAPAPATG